MSRYIDADALRHNILYFADATNLNGNHEQAKAYNHCLIMIDESKTADVVEVVRCKDCENWQIEWLTSCKDDNYHYCAVIDNTCEADFFCALGERRKE